MGSLQLSPGNGRDFWSGGAITASAASRMISAGPIVASDACHETGGWHPDRPWQSRIADGVERIGCIGVTIGPRHHSSFADGQLPHLRPATGHTPTAR